MVAAAEYYRDRLGFSFERFWGEPPGFCMVWRDDHCIMLSRVEDAAAVRPVSTVNPAVWDAYFWVRDVDRLFAELVARGAKIAAMPFDKPYEVREGVALDLDGHQIAFGQDIGRAGE